MGKRFLFVGLWLFVVFLCTFMYYKFVDYNIVFKPDLKVNVNEDVKIKDFIMETNNLKVLNETEKVDTTKMGKSEINLNGKTFFGKKEFALEVSVIDSQSPKIEAPKEITITRAEKVDLLRNVKVTDNSKEEIVPQVEGDYDINKIGTYSLKYVASDSNENKAESEFKLIVKEIPVDENSYIKINRKQNVVMVYSGDHRLIKTFLCSAGIMTPMGTFYTSDKYEWRELYGKVYGQYSTRITGHILFHSVPYYKKDKSTLEYFEYNKLGVLTSMGCIRLTVEDAKWIYDNMPKGTKVIIYDSDSLDGIIKPTVPKIDVNSPNRGWDPTDPDPNNPWKG